MADKKKERVLTNSHIFSGIYTNHNLPTYFQCLEKACKNFHAPLSFEIATGYATFTINYHDSKWIYADAKNGMKKKELSSEEISQFLLKYYQAPLIFSSKPYINKEDTALFEQSIALLQKDAQWMALHETISAEQNKLKDSHGYNLLLLAVKNNDIATVKRCIQAPGIDEIINQRDKNGFPPLSCALVTENIEIIKLLLNVFKNKNINPASTASGDTVLYFAVMMGNVEVVRETLKVFNQEQFVSQIMVRTRNTALQLAVQQGNLAIVQEFLKVLNDEKAINQAIGVTYTTLHYAINKNNLKIVQELLKVLKDEKIINHASEDGYPPLHYAIEKGYLEIVQEFLKVLKDVKIINQSMNNGPTALYLAVNNGHIEIVKALLNVLDKTQINATTNHRATPIGLAVQNGHTVLVKALLEKGADLKQAYPMPIDQLIAAQSDPKEQEKLKLLLAKIGIEHNIPLFTPLHAAVLFRHKAIVELLQKNGAKFDNIQDYKLAVGMNQIQLLPLELQNQCLKLEEIIKLIKPQLKTYQKSRNTHFQIKDLLFPADKHAKDKFIDYLTDKINFLDSGIPGLYQAIEGGLKKFPGVHFQTTLHQLMLLLLEDKPKTNYAKYAQNILKRQMILNPPYVSKMSELYKKIDALSVFGQELTNPQQHALTNLASELKKDVDFLISQNAKTLPNKASFEQFYAKFNARLHSQDVIMSHHENWNALVVNLLLAVVTVGLTLGIKAVHSKLTSGKVTLFSHDSEKQKKRDAIQESLNEVYSLINASSPI